MFPISSTVLTMLLKFDDIITDKPITDKSRPKNAGFYLYLQKISFVTETSEYRHLSLSGCLFFLDLNRGEVLNARPDSSFTL